MGVTNIDADEASRAEYLAEGERRARALPNRGPIRFEADGDLAWDIVEAYSEYGFYVFEDVVGDAELQDLRDEAEALIARAPFPVKGSPTDRQGRPALGYGKPVDAWLMARPLSDPVGGTDRNNGRHPSKMYEPPPPAHGPEEVPYLMLGCLEHMESFLRVYGHPDLLRVAEAVNGPDFTPFNEALFIKLPGLGPSVAWHQDGQIHWDHPDWDEGTHGFNFQLQLYGSTAANGVWVVPGTHRMGKLDIKSLVADNGGSERLPGAVPLVCEAGGCFITNRQTLHGSFANTSPDKRLTVNFGFHRYRSVINQRGVLSGRGQFYDSGYVRQRCRCIALAIDARAQRYPHEERYVYQPFVGEEHCNRYDDETRREVLTDYNRRDLGI